MKEFLRKNKLLLILAALNFLLIYISVFNSAYGYFIDEFYYIACALRPALGYVDHPPLAPLLLAAFISVFGKSLFAIRFLPALASSVTVFLTGLLAEELGGKEKAKILAALAMLCTPVNVAFSGFYSMNVFEPVFSILMILCLIKIVKQNNVKLWIPAGIIMGLGMMNKHTFALAVAFAILALLVSGHYKLLLNRWFAFGMAAAFIIVLPNILWQYCNHFPSAEFYRNISTGKNIYTPPLKFITEQIINMSFANVYIWAPGVFYILFGKSFRNYRFLALFFVFTFLFMLASGTSRADRTLFAYPVVFAGGAIMYERLLKGYKNKIIISLLALQIIAGLVITLPLVLPYFGYGQVAGYVKKLGINTELEKGKKPPLPQLLADRIGWEEKCNLLFCEYNKLPDSVKKETIILTDNYGKAGALELYGNKYGINQVFCAHNTYFLWGLGKLHGRHVLALGNANEAKGYATVFGKVEIIGGEFTNAFVSPHENNLLVMMCSNPKEPLNALFAKHHIYW